ncbi:hypothetical protein D081_2267 [Anaerovibrio sp. JC8]|uniref:hypothetical protein n=1 Tax=Anaerovibrio sp. JC8 TaxID=1240085 RepID=UPI000A0CE55B|nr:hypothetical protein [Anaerovibrio sp. JC8]ORT98981.1 hypothetical protein D081_2267 [Anaerovibrio sp. JC8]
MKPEILEKIQQETADWAYLDELPAEMYGLALSKRYKEVGDTFELFSYTNEAKHLALVTYYHQETKEYKLKIRRGLTEFCLMEFITASFGEYEQHLRKNLESAVHDLAIYNPDAISYVTKAMKIPEWDYKGILPEELEGYKLFINPTQMVRVLNGSYIVFDYSDFEIESNFIIYYNEFRSEFFGEARIRNIPEMNYTFDSKSLLELEDKLKAHLVDRLREVRQRASQ